jgi:hypothetical protein
MAEDSDCDGDEKITEIAPCGGEECETHGNQRCAREYQTSPHGFLRNTCLVIMNKTVRYGVPPYEKPEDTNGKEVEVEKDRAQDTQRSSEQ